MAQKLGIWSFDRLVGSGGRSESSLVAGSFYRCRNQDWVFPLSAANDLL